MELKVRPYQLDDAERWDRFCARTDQATFLHYRLFLSYHRERFLDRSLILEDEDGWVGVLPAAQHPVDPTQVVSHPGITYGGLLHAGALRGSRMVTAMKAVCDHFNEMDYERLLYKAVPTFYQRRPSQDDLYALFRLNAQRIRCDLSSTIDLSHRGVLGERRRRSLKKAQKAGVVVRTGIEYLPSLWKVVTDNLARKHDANPVHSLSEIELLMQRFPDNIHCVCGLVEEEVVAGVIVFSTPTANHAQYIASSMTGYAVSALDVVFDYCFRDATQAQKRWFDFGISTEAGGARINDGLYGFKTEFGGGGFVHDFYELKFKEL